MKGMYSDAVVIATLLTILLMLVAWMVWAVAGPLIFSAIVAVAFWRVVFVWVMDT